MSMSLSAQSYLKAVRSFDLKVLSYQHNKLQPCFQPCLLPFLHEPMHRVVLTFCGCILMPATQNAIPDIDPHPYHWRVDPYEPNRVSR